MLSGTVSLPREGGQPAGREQTSPELLAACQAGDRAAIERLFSNYAPSVYRWAVMLGLSAQDAEDAAQETLATAARRIATCNTPAALHSWLFQITRRVTANARRSAWVRRILRGDSDEEEPAFESSSSDAGQELAIRRCFKRLSRPHAEVLLLAGVEGYTVPEVAALLGIPEGTVASRLRLARVAFQRHWEAP
jgi:RNA polymerase sigma-70 factor, ECF subfamily